MSYFPPYDHGKNKMKVKLDLPSYGIKFDLKNVTGVDTSDFAKQADLDSVKSEVEKLAIDELKNVPSGLNSLKSNVDKLDIGRLETASADLSKLSDAVQKYDADYDAKIRET